MQVPTKQSTYNPSQTRPTQPGVIHPFPFFVLSCSQTHSGITLGPFRHTSFTHSAPPSRFIERSVRTLSRKCLPSRNRSLGQNMTLFSLAAAVEVRPVRYVLPLSTHVQELTTSWVASCLALWRKDSPHRGIRKARRYLRKRWWVSLFWRFAYARNMDLSQVACRKR